MDGYNNCLKCKICGRSYWDGGNPPHQCPPKMFYRYTDEDDWIDIYADCMYEAAEKVAEQYNEIDGDLPLLKNDNQNIRIVVSDGNIEKAFKVFADVSIDYFAVEE